MNKAKALLPNLIGGAAALAPSTKTYMNGCGDFSKDNYGGCNLHFGVRELAMAAIGNGIMLYGGLKAFVSTFFVFSDYTKPMARLSSLMKMPLTYVFTHDSIGVGEDGPTHQPIEHLASYRAMPNIYTFRPCDVVETAEAWQIALASEKTPSIFALTRQSLPLLRSDAKENLTAKGGYIISGDEEKRVATIIATGSEVSLAIEAQKTLKEEGIDVAVVSMPCTELFDKQPVDYQEKVLGKAPRIAVEAAAKFGWEKYVGLDGDIIGMDGFGASAPADQLYDYFGITKEEIVDSVKNCLK